MKNIRIATRASKLALAQSNQVLRHLSAKAPDISFSLVEISTKGDRDKSDFLYKSSSVGFFTSEVEKALLDRRADIAVHSLKDLPTALTEGLAVTAIPVREQVGDVLLTTNRIGSLRELPRNARVGTSSLRRITQLKLVRPDLDCQPLRGNVETRIRSVSEGRVDAIVIARAGLNRLGLFDERALALPPEEFIPAPGQGALAIQTRRDDPEVVALVSQLDDRDARLTAETERLILAGLHGGCSIPLGVYSRIEADKMHIHAVLCDLAATRPVRKSVTCPLDSAAETARRITQEILDAGGRQILQELRNGKEQ